MLSYRHAFHAGNHADVLKHWVLVEILLYLREKGKPFHYIDTHAGAGVYHLQERYASQNTEFNTGIGRLWAHSDLPGTLQQYVDTVKIFNPDGTLTYYPGSPGLAAALLLPSSHMQLFELHPSDFEQLSTITHTQHWPAHLAQRDGFNGLKAILPPTPRRALILIDPPYEQKKDYQTVLTALHAGLKRFATGIYMIWYPCLQRAEVQGMLSQLKNQSSLKWLNVELQVSPPSADGFGMHGSGLFIVNPPWTLAKSLPPVLNTLTHLLADHTPAHYSILSNP